MQLNDECGVCDGPGAIYECGCSDIAADACDCDGNVEDCAGECGGSAVVDECGECGGDGIADGACDCEGNVLDECGECGGDGIADGACDCDGSVEDCAGECGGSAAVDECGECGGDGIGEGLCDCDDTLPFFTCEDGSMVCEESDCGPPEVTDGCELPMNNLYLLDGDVLYNSDTDIAGFQFNVEGTTVSGASGGAAEEAGFTVSTGGTVVLGFSFSGAVVPAGCGTLTSLVLDGEASGLVNIVISDPAGGDLGFVYYEGPVIGCMDESACNYNADAVWDDGSCTYPEENLDCDGNCLVEVDCNGECGGTATEDECGVCEGPGAVYECGCEGYSECWDGSEVCDIADCPDTPLENTTLWISDVGNGSVSINLFNEEPVAGFQFTVTSSFGDFTVNGASGGSAADAGFTVSTAPTGIVLGFSFTGATIPVGQGVLTYLDASWSGDNGYFDLEDVTLSDSAGSSIDFDLGEPFIIGDITFGCTDMDACNYDSSANMDDGSCDYSCYGCTDPGATNYDPDATMDDGSCFYEELDPPENLTASAGDQSVTLNWDAPGGGGGGGGDDGPCSSTFMAYGSDPTGYLGECYTDGSAYFYFEWEGGCLATNINYSGGDLDLSAYGFTEAFYFYGFPLAAEETFTMSFDDGTSAYQTVTADCNEQLDCEDLPGTVQDCADDDCCPESWIGDGL